MDWTTLGIAPTKDKKAITAAYRIRLASVNPEDKPEEFKALRAAYEEALRLAEEAEEAPVRDESPVGLWMEQVRNLYQDFPARIQPENWKALLSQDVCVALDQRPLAEEALLKFLMDSFYIPQSVWQVLDDMFSWSARREELYEHYSRDFVDYAIMNGIRYPASLPYELFTPGESAQDCDRYRRLYFQARRAEGAEQGQLLAQLTELSEDHPYGQALCCQFTLENGEPELGRAGLRKLAEEYPREIPLVMDWAIQCAKDEDWVVCEKLTRQVLEQNPEHGQAKRLLADCLGKTHRQEEAKELLFELIYAAGGDQKQIYYLNQAIMELNQSLISRWEAELAQNPEDQKAALELGWCYLQNERADDALAICRRLDPEYEDRYAYHNLYAKTCYYSENFGEALEHVQLLEAVLKTMEPDGTKETAKRLKRMPELLQMEGGCLYALHRPEEGREKFAAALAISPEDPGILTQMAHLLAREKDYEPALEVLTKLTEVQPGSSYGYYLLANTLFELRRDRAAFDAVNRSLELDGSELAVYVLKIRILIRNGVWDGVQELLDFLHKNGITEDLSVLWCEAQQTEFEKKDKAAALARYQAIASRLEAGESLSWASQVYFRITVLLAEDKDARKKEDRDALLEVLDQGLKQDPEDPDCMDYKAWLLKRDNQTEAAIALYHKLEAKPHHSLNVERELAELYYKDLERYADKSLHYYQLLLDHEENDALHFYAGFCCRAMGDLEGAERHFLRERELTPEDVDAYRGLSLIYEAMGRLDEALENAEKAMELKKDAEGNQSRYYFRRIQILRRQGRAIEAVRTVDAVEKRYGYDGAARMVFEIYCQFGMWEEASQHLKSWKKRKTQRESLAWAQIKLDQLMGRYDKARAALSKDGITLTKEDRWNLQLSMDELDGNIAGQFRDWKVRRDELGKFTEHILMNLAQVCWWSGDYDRARDFAQQALEKEDAQLKLFFPDRILWRGRRGLMLAILGREEEARAELEKVQTIPLCENCEYSACKDAGIYAPNIEEVCGRFERAAELYKAGRERWPDDIDFAAGLLRLKRRGIST